MTFTDSIYQSVVEDQTELIRRFRPDGNLTFVNSACCRFYRKAPEELLGVNYRDLLAPDERAPLVKLVESICPENPEILTEPSYSDADGQIRFVQYVTRGFFDENGDVVEYQSVGRDVTAQRQAEATLAEARIAMEQASRVTTLAVIGGGIAHEINQPLNAIRILTASAQIVAERSGQSESELARMLRDIASQVDRIDSIVNHLREHLRQNQSTASGNCDLGNAVRSALSLMGVQLTAKGIKLDLNISPDVPLVSGTSIRFEELVVNLVANAMQAFDGAEREQKVIQIDVASRNADTVELVVADNGSGFEEELAEKMFEPFFSTKSRGASMGLGLSIVRIIVQAAGGSITAQNRSAGGALIRVVLPAVGWSRE